MYTYSSFFIERLRAWTYEQLRHSEGEKGSIWSDAWSYLKYILALPIDDLKLIVFHTAPYGGCEPSRYWEERYGPSPPEHRDVVAYRRVVEGIPEAWRLSEFEVSASPFQHGVRWNDKLINKDVVRCQSAVSNLYSTGILDSLRATPRPLVCEIGAGVGRLAAFFGLRLSHACYVIVDLPQTLFTAGVYLTLNCSSNPIYLVQQDDSAESVRTASARCSFILVPPHRLDALSLMNFDLVLNLLSFQEMAEQVLDGYLRFFSGTSNGPIYSSNWPKHKNNARLTATVDDVLARYYGIHPSQAFYEQQGIAEAFGNSYHCHKRTYFGWPLRCGPRTPSGSIRIADGMMTLAFDALNTPISARRTPDLQ